MQSSGVPGLAFHVYGWGLKIDSYLNNFKTTLDDHVTRLRRSEYPLSKAQQILCGASWRLSKRLGSTVSRADVISYQQYSAFGAARLHNFVSGGGALDKAASSYTVLLPMISQPPFWNSAGLLLPRERLQ